MYYIKKLQKQEMGSPDISGKTHRGRYIYLSKDSGDFFPHMSKIVENDTLVLPIVMPHRATKIYAKFVYHNSKYSVLNPVERPRNEYRLYLNNDIDNNKEFFHVGDIVVIEKVDILTDYREDGEIPSVYSISLFNVEDVEYTILDEIISESEMRGEHALYNDKLDFITTPSLDILNSAEISDEIIDVVEKQQQELIETISNSDDNGESIEDIRGANLFNSVSFRDFVMMAYSYKCAITGKSISYQSLINLEAAHIQPKAHAGTFLPCNGLALSRDMHWAFDKGLFTISDDYKVVVHDKVKSTLLSEYDGKYINIPKDDYFKPEKKFLKHHRDNVFGLFINSGSIRTL